MPRTISTTTTITDAVLASILIERTGPSAFVATETYRLVRDDGSVHEVKRVGAISIPSGVASQLEAFWQNRQTAIRTREEV